MSDSRTHVGEVRLDDFDYRTDWLAHDRPSTAVVIAVADAIETDQADLPVFNDTVDGDALDTLLTDTDDAVDVTFEYAGVFVYISSTGTLAVDTS